MKIQVSAAKALSIDPTKRYLLVIIPRVTLPGIEIDELKSRMHAALPNVTVEVLPAGTKYKMIEGGNAAEELPPPNKTAGHK